MHKEARLEYLLIEATTQSEISHVTDWSSNHLHISRATCDAKWFQFIFDNPAYLGVFVFKWREYYYAHLNINACSINKPDQNTLIVIDPQFIPVENMLDVCEKIEASRIFMEKHSV